MTPSMFADIYNPEHIQLMEAVIDSIDENHAVNLAQMDAAHRALTAYWDKQTNPYKSDRAVLAEDWTAIELAAEELSVLMAKISPERLLGADLATTSAVLRVLTAHIALYDACAALQPRIAAFTAGEVR